MLGYTNLSMLAFSRRKPSDSARPASSRTLLFVVTGLGWGGAETQVIELALAFRRRGWTVGVASLLEIAERRDALEQQGIPVFTLGMIRGVPDPRAIFRLAAIIRDFRPSVVHSHMVHANLLTRVSRLVVRTPVLITTAHNINEGAYWRMVAYRLTDSLTDLTTNVSHAAVARSIERGAVPRDRVRFVPNGVDFSQFRRDDRIRSNTRRQLNLRDEFVWLAIGRLEEQKDYPNLLRAFHRVRERSANSHLLVVGDGPLQKQVQALVAELGLSNVSLLGKRGDVPALMNAADGFVLSSAWEGLPMVLLEAAAANLPIVTTDVGGCAQVVESGKSGFLVPARNSGTLAEAMAMVTAMSSGERENLGRRAAEHVLAQFSMANVVALWESIYTQIANDSERLMGSPKREDAPQCESR